MGFTSSTLFHAPLFHCQFANTVKLRENQILTAIPTISSDFQRTPANKQRLSG
jgi:hypothetical protein